MRINELTADEFTASAALLGEAVEGILNGELGTKLKSDVAERRSNSGEEKTDAVEWAVDVVSSYIPMLLKSNVGDVYKLLAACDGQTVDEYKACFTPAKLMQDVAALKDALKDGGELRDLVSPFLA